MIKPMLLKTLKDKDDLSTYEGAWLAQEKYDGTRVIVEKRNGKVTMQTRSGKNDLSSDYPDIANELVKCAGGRFILDGELVFFDKNDMPVFLTGLAKESRKDYIPYLIVFDILEYGNNDTIESYRMREQYKRSLYVENFIRQREFKYIKAIETFEKDFDGLYNGIIACGGEGIVLKRYSAVYQEGKRSADWLKVKRQETHDCFIIGLMKGEGKYADTFGSLVLGQFDEQGFLVQCGACSGFSDDIRRYLYDAVMAQPEACVFPVTKRTEYHYVRRVAPKIVVEVECMERYDTGAMRHPRFLRIRTDKDPSECRYNG